MNQVVPVQVCLLPRRVRCGSRGRAETVRAVRESWFIIGFQEEADHFTDDFI